MELKEEMVSQQTVYEGIIVNVRRDKARLLDGRIANREVVEHPGGVAVFAMDGQGRVALVRQFRYPLGEVTLELPAGKLEPGEDPGPAACGSWRRDGTDPGDLPASGQHRLPPRAFWPSGFTSFFARDLVQGRPAPMTGSLWRPSGFPTRICWTWPAGGEIQDGKTLAGILKASLPAGGAPKPETKGTVALWRKSKRSSSSRTRKNIVDILRFNLRKEGYDTLEAFDGVTTSAWPWRRSPDLILLDLMLPEMNGFEVCKLLRDKGKNTPVLIITAREEEKDKILGLDLGADDYITKPFSVRELMARVKAHIRRVALIRQSAGNQEDRLDFWPSGDPQGECPGLARTGRLELTQREFELLTYLASHAGRVFSRQELMERVWN